VAAAFPNLRPGNHTQTSAATPSYNCIAWAAGDSSRWWEPTAYCYWPRGVPRQYTVDAYAQAYATLGYVDCPDGSAETGFEKLAIYADFAGTPTHAARLLPSGQWTSKLGQDIDISHTTPADVAGPLYGRVVRYMKRPKSGA
jgi:hypothetical protein